MPRAAVESAREQEAMDLEIQGAVLIAVAFRMYNQYVDGFATWQHHIESMYAETGDYLVREGYRTPSIRP